MKEKAEGCLVRGLVYLRAVCIRKRLHKCITVHLMLGDVVSMAHDDGLIESLDFAVRVRMIRCCYYVFDTEKGAHLSEEITGKLSTIFIEYIRLDAVRDELLIGEDTPYVCGCCLGCWESSIQLEVLVGDDKYVLSTLCCFKKCSCDIHCVKFERFRCLEKQHFMPMEMLGVASYVACACAYNLIDFGSHMKPVNVGKKCAVHASLA